MKTYLLYKDRSVRSFKRLAGGGQVFDKYRSLATSFIRYAGTDLDNNLALYGNTLDIQSIRLEDVFPAKYRWLVRDVELRNSKDYLENLEQRIQEFQGKEDNLKILVGVLFIKFVLITKIVETYLSSAVSLKENGVDISKIDTGDIGIGNSTLKYFDELQTISGKTIDEWLSYTADSVEAKYFYSSMKRILTILIGDDK